MNDTICDKQRHTGTARKRLYVHANTGCNATSTNTLSGFVQTLLD
ncbi:hypothetical protein T01_12643 [Trichinella spiralis]|uniref:Uncharacterized protein n=1 Tax=Trichinella spiralis TaxID=6334 RepID=A0A0V0ZMU1_TRISP|nr:hypothetical protein T01_10191 [Trichinella spiralis]KRY13676.1 hypothetical protein T01_12643 [Trichinella spiralis]